MKRINLLIYLLLAFSGASQAQTQIQFWSDTFEDTGAPSSGTRSPENNGGSTPAPFMNYFVRTTNTGVALTTAYTAYEGGKFWAGENHSGVFGAGNEEQQIDFKGINITGKTGLVFKGLFAANAVSQAWDNRHYQNSTSTTTDYIYAEYSIDGGVYQPLIKFFGNNGLSKNLSEDTGVDSIGDGTMLTSAFKEFSKTIAVTGTKMDIRIKVYSNAANEEWAIDNFRLFETQACTIAVASAAIVNASCKGGNDGAATVAVTGANGAVTYDWTPGNPSGDGTSAVTGLKAGTYTCTVKDAANCSKAVEIKITEPAVALSATQTLTICTGKSVTVGTKTYTTSGHYTDVVKSWKGCDSTVTTDLTVTPALTKNQEFTVCAGKSVTVGTHTYTITGTYTDKFKTTGGCDSIVTTKLTVLKQISTTQNLTVCKGNSVTVGTHTYNVAGTYTDVLTATNKCDSTVITHLIVVPAITHTQSPSICAGGSFQVANHIYTKSGSYKDTLKTKGGCDSIVNTYLYVSMFPLTGSQTVKRCSGNPLVIGTHVYTKSGTYKDTTKTKSGCDSVITTYLTVTPAVKYSQAFTICTGKAIVVGTHVYSATGIYTDTVKTKAGCDSIITTKLTVSPILSGSQQFTICAGQSVIVGTHTYTVSGTYKDTLHGDTKCDSVIITHLEVIPSVKAAQKVSTCANKPLIIGAHSYSATGVYTDTMKTKDGCDSILTTSLTVNPLPVVTLDLHAIDTVCINAGNIQLTGGLPAGGVYHGPGVSNNVFNPLTAGVGTHAITYSYKDSTGCDGDAKASIFVDVCLSVKNKTVQHILDVYPNPYTEKFTIELVVAKSSEFTIKLTNVLGETVKEIEKSFLTGVYKNEISTKELPNGIYFITVQTADSKMVQRIIKN